MFAMKNELICFIEKLTNTINIDINEKDNEFKNSLERAT